MDAAFQYIKDKGIASGTSYPYVGKDQKCKIDGGSRKVTGYVNVAGCDNLLNTLFQRPASVAVDATNWSPYRTGVFSNCKA